LISRADHENVNDVVTIFAAARLVGAVGGCESGEFVVIFNEVLGNFGYQLHL
jgi:hypothetical protein